jgi:hypothetical protein
MKQAQAFQVEQNQPAIANLTTQKGSLQDQYTSLLADIKGQGSASVNQATTAENNLLGQRGITNDSPLYGQQMSQALIPVNQQYGGIEASLGQGSATTLTDLAGQIASLQAGNVPSAQNFGANIAGLQAQIQAAQIAANKPFAASGPVYNPSTGQYTMPPTTSVGGNTTTGGGNTSGGGNTTTTPTNTNTGKTILGPTNPNTTTPVQAAQQMIQPTANSGNQFMTLNPYVVGQLGLGSKSTNSFQYQPGQLSLQ